MSNELKKALGALAVALVVLVVSVAMTNRPAAKMPDVAPGPEARTQDDPELPAGTQVPPVPAH